jgi:hypothetical protein
MRRSSPKGLQLFNDASLSGGGSLSCASRDFFSGHTNDARHVRLVVVVDGRGTPTSWDAGELYGRVPTAAERHGLVAHVGALFVVRTLLIGLSVRVSAAPSAVDPIAIRHDRMDPRLLRNPRNPRAPPRIAR